MKKHGEKLYTVEFSSSYDYEYDDPTPQKKTPKRSPKKPIILTKYPQRQIKKDIPNTGGLIELSYSYEDSDTDGNVKSKVKKVNINKEYSSSSSSENSEDEKDVFTLDDKHKDFHTTDSVTTKTTARQIENNNNNIYIDDNQDSSKTTSDSNKNIFLDNNQDSSKTTSNNNNNIFLDRNQSDESQKEDSENSNNPIEDTKNDTKEDNQPDQTKIEDQSQNDPILSTKSLENQENPQIAIYLITREKKTHINGTRLFFNFFVNEQHIYTAKCKTKKAHHVYIMKGDNAHLGSEADAIILIGNKSSDFSLREKRDLGSEILTIRILPPRTTADTSRKMTVSFFSPLNGTPKKIFTKCPGLNHNGKIEHDFEGKFAIESIKNAVLVAKHDGPKMMFIRKTGDDSIEIEAYFKHVELWIFAIGIASFLSKVKGIK